MRYGYLIKLAASNQIVPLAFLTVSLMTILMYAAGAVKFDFICFQLNVAVVGHFKVCVPTEPVALKKVTTAWHVPVLGKELPLT